MNEELIGYHWTSKECENNIIEECIYNLGINIKYNNEHINNIFYIESEIEEWKKENLQLVA